MNAAIIAVGGIFCLFSCFSVLTSVLWAYGIDCAKWSLAGFAVPVLLLAVYAVYCLRCNSKSMVRDRLNYWVLTAFAPALLIYIGLELFTGYQLNTANIKRKRLNEYYYQELDDEKLCSRLLTGADPAAEPYKSGTPEEILKSGKVPQFKGVYTGDLMSSFGDGGKVYLRLGKYTAQKMKKAAEKRDSAEFAEQTGNMVKILVRSAGCVRDPEKSALILGRELCEILQKYVTVHFPDKTGLDKSIEAVNYLRERFEAHLLGYVIYDTQSVLSAYDALLKDPGRISKMVNSDLAPIWSDIDIVAGKLFPAARRSRLVGDYAAAVDMLNVYRSVASTCSSSVTGRLKGISDKLVKLQSARCYVALALLSDMRPELQSAGAVQHLIENAQMAMEVELYRRERNSFPKTLDDIKSGRLMYIPNGHIDGSEYRIVKGKFKDSSGKEFAGYALTVPTGSFVITDHK